MANSSRQALRPPQAAQKLGIGLSTLWMKIKHDPGFPQPFKVSARVTVLFEDELDAWMEAAAALASRTRDMPAATATSMPSTPMPSAASTPSAPTEQEQT